MRFTAIPGPCLAGVMLIASLTASLPAAADLKVVTEVHVTGAPVDSVPTEQTITTYYRGDKGRVEHSDGTVVEKLGKSKGFPLYSHLTIAPPLQSGVRDPIIVTSKVKSVSEEGIGDSLFILPTDYTKTEPRPRTPKHPLTHTFPRKTTSQQRYRF